MKIRIKETGEVYEAWKTGSGYWFNKDKDFIGWVPRQDAEVVEEEQMKEFNFEEDRPKGKPIEYYENDKGCHICTSHHGNTNRGPYPMITHEGRRMTIARHIFQKQNGVIPEGIIIRHACDNPRCINPDHLLLGTHKDNTKDRDKRGRSVNLKGSEHGMAKLTEEQVREIREDTERSIVQMADDYGVCYHTIYNIRGGKIWKHLL